MMCCVYMMNGENALEHMRCCFEMKTPVFAGTCTGENAMHKALPLARHASTSRRRNNAYVAAPRGVFPANVERFIGFIDHTLAWKHEDCVSFVATPFARNFLRHAFHGTKHGSNKASFWLRRPFC